MKTKRTISRREFVGKDVFDSYFAGKYVGIHKPIANRLHLAMLTIDTAKKTGVSGLVVSGLVG